MTGRVEDYSDLLKSLDEILQSEHDVEDAASAAAIRALLAERDALKAENRYLCTALWKNSTKEGEECDEGTYDE